MRFFSLAILLGCGLVSLLSCSNGPMLESDLFRTGYEEELYNVAPPSTDISSDEVELHCKDMSYEESIDCVASLNDQKQEVYKTWQAKKSEQTKQTKQTKKSKKAKKAKPKKAAK